jgi:hypothetical protein
LQKWHQHAQRYDGKQNAQKGKQEVQYNIHLVLLQVPENP